MIPKKIGRWPETNAQSSGGWKSVGALPLAAFLILMGLLSTRDSSVAFESPILLAFLNTIFLSIIPLAVAYQAAKSHQATGIFAFLMAGCGLVFFGVTSLYAGWVMPLAGGPNPNVTLHNLGSLFAGFFQFVGAHFFMQELAGAPGITNRVRRVRIFYAGIVVLVSITTALAFWGNPPVFFDPLMGASPLRQFVLGGAICLFAAAGLVFMEIYATTRTEFAYWYGLALWLIATGLTCVLLQPNVGSMIGWAGRGAQYLGCVYFIFAFLQGQRERPASDFSSTAGADWAFWPYLEHRVRERTAALLQINADLQKEIAERKRAEDALRWNQTLLQLMSNSSPFGYLVVDGRTGDILHFNQRFCEIWGIQHLADRMQRSELKYQDLLSACLPVLEDAPAFVESGESLQDEANRTVLEDEIAFTEGRTIRRFTTQIRGVDDEYYGRFYIFEDVTGRKQVEESLKQSETRYRLLADHMTDKVWLMDMNLKLTYVSPSVEKMRGYTLEELQKLPLDQNLAPSSFQQAMEVFAEELPKVMADSTYSVERAMELEFRQKDGSTYWEENKLSVIRDENGSPISILGEGRDVTERKRAEAALRASEAKNRALVDAIPDMLFVLTQDGIFIDYHAPKGQLLLAPPETFLGKKIQDVLPLHVVEAYSSAVHHVTQTGQSQSFQYALDLQDGQRYYEARVVAYQNDNILCIIHDTTERKLAEEALNESKLLFHLLIETLHQNIYAKSVDGRFIFANQHYCATEGKPLEEIIGKTDFELHPRELAEKYFIDDRLVLETGKTIELEEIHQPLGKEKFYVQVIKTPFYYSKGQPAGILGIFWDITERRQAEEVLKLRESYLTAIIENQPGLVSLKDLQGRFLAVNGLFTLACKKKTPDEIIGKTDLDIWPRELAEKYRADDIEVIQKKKPLHVEESFVDEGQTKWFETFKTPVLDETGRVIGTTSFARDITARKQAEVELLRAKETLDIAHNELKQSFVRQQQLARMDALTGINNRGSLFELAGHEFDVALRYQRPLAMMMFDIDDFKQINDTFGHLIGDQALVKVTQIVCAKLRSADVIGRYGGDEFIVLLPQTSAEEALILAERIHAGIATLSLDTDKGPLIVTISISLGIAQMLPGDSAPGVASSPDTVENLFLRADQSLYAAKQSGKNRSVVFKSSDQ